MLFARLLAWEGKHLHCRLVHIKTGLMIKLLTLVFVCHKQVNVKKISVLQGAPINGLS